MGNFLINRITKSRTSPKNFTDDDDDFITGNIQVPSYYYREAI